MPSLIKELAVSMKDPENKEDFAELVLGENPNDADHQTTP